MGLFDFLNPAKAAQRKALGNLAPAFEAVGRAAFPGGQDQMQDEGKQLHEILEGKLTEQESLNLVLKLRGLAVFTGDFSEERLTRSMIFTLGAKLTDEDRKKNYDFLMRRDLSG